MRLGHPLEKFGCGGEKRGKWMPWVLWRWGKAGGCFEVDEISACLKADYVEEKKESAQCMFPNEGAEGRIQTTGGFEEMF